MGQLTGEYLVLSGLARFLVEFIRINPRIYWGMSNAQVASLGSIVAGLLLMVWARRRSATARAAEVMPTKPRRRVSCGLRARKNSALSPEGTVELSPGRSPG